MQKSNVGILLTNIGSPAQATPKEVRRYLKKFLSDSRVVEIPKLLWWPILHGIILPFRSKSSAKLYQSIWTPQGSPLTYHSEQIKNTLQSQLQLPVEIGMHYGDPSIPVALEKLRSQQIQKLLVLPMYPQYSATTTAVTFDQLARVLKTWRYIPEISMVNHYAENNDYIDAICASIQKESFQHLLFSFHGIPKRCIELGDPYALQCKKSVDLITSKLNLSQDQWSLAFQSRIGRAKWLTPYTEKTLQELPQRGITNLHVICPGFAVDCLETLEEINIRGRETFLKAGGKSFTYIPALNHSEIHLNMLKNIILNLVSHAMISQL